MKGRIVRGIGGFYYVEAQDGNEYECKARGVFRYNSEKPLPGDYCDIEIIDAAGKTGNIVSILPRKSFLIRPAAANFDRAFICFAAKDPDPNLGLLDRFLVNTMEKDIDTVIILNKVDLVSDEAAESLKKIYSDAGYEVILTSTKQGIGMDTLRGMIKDTTSILSGPSGVGKSSIVNSLYGSKVAESGKISEKIKRGKNTTRSSTLLCLKSISDETYIMDTPGFSSLYNELEPAELALHFKEMQQYFGRCRFTGCVHMEEPDCAVKDAVQAGLIHRERYDSYRNIYEELMKRRKW